MKKEQLIVVPLKWHNRDHNITRWLVVDTHGMEVDWAGNIWDVDGPRCAKFPTQTDALQWIQYHPALTIAPQPAKDLS